MQPLPSLSAASVLNVNLRILCITDIRCVVRTVMASRAQQGGSGCRVCSWRRLPPLPCKALGVLQYERAPLGPRR